MNFLPLSCNSRVRRCFDERSVVVVQVLNGPVGKKTDRPTFKPQRVSVRDQSLNDFVECLEVFFDTILTSR